MSLQALTPAVAAEPSLAAALDRARQPVASTLDLTAPGALRPFVAAALAASAQAGGADKTVLAVTATSRESDELAAALQSLIDSERVADFPAWETLPHERLSPRSDTVGRRLAVLRRLVHPDDTATHQGRITVVVAPVRSVLQPQVKGLGDLEPVALRTGDTVELEVLVRQLAAAAYTRVDLVERRGEFAVRGGIVDVFPPTDEHPVRIEFWGDEVEEVRSFAVADQRSLDVVPQGLWAPPCRELLLTDEVRRRARDLADVHPELRDMLDKLADGHAVEGMESLAPALVDDMELLVDLLPADALVLVCDPERVRGRAHDLVATSTEFLNASWAAAAVGGNAPVDLGAAAYRTLGDVRTHALTRGMSWWSLSPFGIGAGLVGTEEPVVLRTETGEVVSIEADTSSSVETMALGVRPADTYRGDTGAAVEDITGFVRDGRSVVLVTEGHGPGERLVEVLNDHDIAASLVDDLDPDDLVAGRTSGVVEVV
jgi:transcription-repair coupling factor (superfamily II helicase)